jgi:hypothetical protein
VCDTPSMAKPKRRGVNQVAKLIPVEEMAGLAE